MLPLHTALTTLADIATIQGRTHDAADLARIAEALAGGSTPADASIARSWLDRVRTRGAEQTVDEALTHIPRDLRRLVHDGTLTVAQVAAVVSRTSAVSVGDLGVLLDLTLSDLPTDIREQLRGVLPTLATARPRVPLGRAWTLVETLVDEITTLCPEVNAATAAGSVRRFAALVGDVDVVVSSRDPVGTSNRLGELPATEVLHASPRRAVLRRERSEVTIHLVTRDEYGAALLVRTGSTAHLKRLHERANRRGYMLSTSGLHGASGSVRGEDESAIYAALELPFIAPELRESGDEVDAADQGRLPALLRQQDIRGDLHMHTDWSDGRDTIDVMIAAAEALGYEYVAITDHSASSAVAHGLDQDRLARQADAIAAARERHPRIAILHGAEVDILPDGSLDFPDPVLEQLDLVLASLHDPADQSSARLTDRYIQAMHHPLVHIVTHPTNRLVPGRAGYELDEPRLFDAAIDTGTVLEIDGAPGHLDMDGAMARRAVRAGVDVSVDGDCHRSEWLGRQMLFGVATARRGWVEPRHVVNTRPLGELRSLLARKRVAS
jgi:DNA polymerase (family X)